MLLSRTLWRIRGVLVAFVIRLLGGSVGHGLLVDKGIAFRSLPHRGIAIGDSVYLGRGVVIDVPRTASLLIGSHCHINHYSIISAAASISIGDDTQIGELTSIRDSDHGMGGEPIRSQPLKTAPVSIGSDVWIGRGTAVLRGSEIANGAVVGANSLVTKSVSGRSINVGNPLRTIGTRDEIP